MSGIEPAPRQHRDHSTFRSLPADTIAAISTPMGEGGIGIVRLSGADAIAVAAKRFVSSRGRDIGSGDRQVYHGEIREDGAVLDEVLVHVMRAPHSFTREDVVEVNCHGGPGPLYAVLEAMLRAGARLAEPGEFTKRAFLNGRIDLVQVEAIIDRIRAQTRASLQAADAAARGSLTRAIRELRDSLLHVQAYIEAAVDFPDQDLPELVTPELRREVLGLRSRMQEILDSADAGRLYREGATLAIAGRPNVGKSSLFNALLRESRAIVSAQEGTTRDLIQEIVTFEGIPVRLTDMAGLRESRDEVERLGVERARTALAESQIVALVIDAAAGFTAEDEALATELRSREIPVVLVINKIDLVPNEVAQTCVNGFEDAFALSAKTGEGVAAFESNLAARLRGGREIAADQTLITRTHQKNSLRRALEAVDRVIDNFENSPEFMSIDLREAISALGEITGETTPDDILEQIFAEFCIGK